jgi:hypothetical protein
MKRNSLGLYVAETKKMRKKILQVLAQIPHSSVMERQPHIEHRSILFLSIDRGVIIIAQVCLDTKHASKTTRGHFPPVKYMKIYIEI